MRRDLTTFSRQPQTAPQINWSNSLTRGLVGAWVGSSPNLNLVNNAQLTGGSQYIAPGTNGFEYSPPAGINGFQLLPSEQTPTGPACATLLYRKRDNTNREAVAFGTSLGNDATRFLAHLPYSDGVVYFDYGGISVGSTRLSVAGLTFGNDVWSFNNSPTGLQIWQNGILRASNNNAARTRTNTAGLNIGGVGINAYTDAANTAVFLVHNRALTAAEIISLSRNPWQIFKSTSPVFYSLPSSPTTIDGFVGQAVAAGSAFALNQSIAFGVGGAVAAGSAASVSGYGLRLTWAEAQYQASPNVTIPFGVGNAVAAGSTAGVTLYGSVRVTWAEAQYQASVGGNTISLNVGNAVAGGPAGATVSVDLALVAGPGNAVAGGPSGATVSVNVMLDCDIGDAVAAGQRCQVLPPLTVAPSATPGYAHKTRYRVRVGSRWMEVDPLDPMSVRRAYDAAQEDAQDAATQDVEVPAAVAAQAVVVQPIKGPDYAGLAKEARRISEDIRKVYADALQTALIARLMREQIERDDEDDIAVLLAST